MTDKEFLAKTFIMQMINEDVATEPLTPGNLEFIRMYCARKFMAHKGVIMNHAEAFDYIQTTAWKDLWAGVWSDPPSPGKSVSVFFTNQYR